MWGRKTGRRRRRRIDFLPSTRDNSTPKGEKKMPRGGEKGNAAAMRVSLQSNSRRGHQPSGLFAPKEKMTQGKRKRQHRAFFRRYEPEGKSICSHHFRKERKKTKKRKICRGMSLIIGGSCCCSQGESGKGEMQGKGRDEVCPEIDAGRDLDGPRGEKG